MPLALLFAGQGAQMVGMGKDLPEASPAARDIYHHADEILGWSLSKVSFEGPEETLTKTSVCQPALYVHGLALLAALRERVPPFRFDAAAGLSLGEFTAHAAAGTFSFADGLRLVQVRGRLMQEACESTQGGMIALAGATLEQAAAIAKEADLDVANLNCPGQIVLSGPSARLPSAVESAKAHGVRRAIPLNVAGAYHSRLMKSAQEGLAPRLAEATFSRPAVPVMSNVIGAPAETPQAVRAALARQVCGSVRWEDCVRSLLAMGIRRFVELGPKSGPAGALAGMCRRIDPEISCLSLATFKDIEHHAADLGN
jgi:[acyl-carrier-protein] S-malonyltransferase